MTIQHIKKINGPYKLMVLVFSLLGIIFSFWELIARPFAHNFNKGLAYFSLNTWLESHDLLDFFLVGYASFYLVILAIIAVQFTFRYLTLSEPSLAKKFGGCYVIIWLSYLVLSGAIYGGALYFFCSPDKFSDEYMRQVIYDSYNLTITHIPRFLVIPYADDDSIRWPNLYFLLIGVLNLGLQYFIIIFCGVRTNTILKHNLRRLSIENRRLQKQIFKALVIQTIVPTFLFVLPIAPFLIGPLLDTTMNFPTGWMYVILCLYPPIDTIVYMLIVSEYKRVTLMMLKPFLPKRIKISTDTSMSTPAAIAK
uniref:Seven TM Receptor n=1 Tax=Caenorhabditis tropicalis TaxID=1561998 RepID=A0A1I7T7N9_9PELO